MTCPKSTDLALYAGGEAPHRRIPKVERHIRACPQCMRTVSEFQLIRSAVASTGSFMPTGAREEMRSRILERIAREPVGRVGGSLFRPVLRVACALTIIFASLAWLGTQPEPRSSELPLPVPFGNREPPAHAYRLTSRPARGLDPITPGSARSGRFGTLKSAELHFVDRSDGLLKVAQLRLPARAPNLEIHWIMD